MRAIVVDRWMDPWELEVAEQPEPEVRPGMLVLDVMAAGVSFADRLLVRGAHQRQPPFPFVPGGEVAGVVARVGEGVAGFAPGDRVYGVCGLGGFAEQVLVYPMACRKLPEGLGFEAGAALAHGYASAYAALVFRAELSPGETLLVHAAAGGVGSAAVQIGKALGAQVIATAGSPEKCEVARRAGADHAIDYRKEDFVARVALLTQDRGADVIFDPVGGDVSDRSLKCIAWNGRHVIVGFSGGEIHRFKANRILLKNVAVTGLDWDSYPEKDPERFVLAHEALARLQAQGSIEPLIWKRYALEELPTALDELCTRRTWGKLVVIP